MASLQTCGETSRELRQFDASQQGARISLLKDAARRRVESAQVSCWEGKLNN